METSPMICSTNQWTSLYMIMKELIRHERVNLALSF